MCLVLNQFFIILTIPCATFNDLTLTTTICVSCYYFLNSFTYTITIVQYFIITEIFKPQLFSSHILTEFVLNLLSTLPCPLCRRVSSLINKLEGKCLYLREISINVNKLFIIICVLCLFWPCSVVVACLLFNPLFYILMLLLYFCLFVGNVNKSIIFVAFLIIFIICLSF